MSAGTFFSEEKLFYCDVRSDSARQQRVSDSFKQNDAVVRSFPSAPGFVLNFDLDIFNGHSRRERVRHEE